MRKLAPDVMKGLAVVLMVQVHLMEVFARQDVYDSLFGKISLFLGGPFAAPVFMAVMGYFMALSKKSLNKKLIRAVKILFLGLFLNIALNLNLLIRIFSNRIDVNPWNYIFGVDILFLAGFSIMFIALLSRLFGKRPLLYLGLAVLIALVSPFLPALPENYRAMKYFQALFWGKLWWSYFPLFPWMAYPLAGYAWRLYFEKYGNIFQKHEKAKYWIIALTSLGLILSFPFAFNIVSDLPAYYHHGFYLFLWNSGFLILISYLISGLCEIFHDTIVVTYLARLGKNVTIAYVIQWIIIGNLGTWLFKTQFPLPLILWFVGIMALTSLFSSYYMPVMGRLRGLLRTSN